MRDPLVTSAPPLSTQRPPRVPTYTGGTLTSVYAPPKPWSTPARRPDLMPAPKITRMRPEEDFSPGGMARRRWDAIDQWAATNKQVSAYDEKAAAGTLQGRSYLAGDYIDRQRAKEAELYEQITSRETIAPTHPAVQSLVRDLKNSGVNVSATDIARTVRLADLDVAANAVMSRTHMNADGTMSVDQRGVTNIILSLQQSQPQLASMLPQYIDAKIQEEIANAASLAKKAAQDETVIDKGLAWAGENVLMPVLDVMDWGAQQANQVIRGTYYGLRQAENPLDFAMKYVQAVVNPTGLAMQNWDKVEVGDWNEEGLAALREQYPAGRVDAALEFSKAIGEGDPDRIYKMLESSDNPDAEAFLEGIIYAKADGQANDPDAAALLRKVEELNLGSTGSTVLSSIFGDVGSGSVWRGTAADMTSFGTAFIDPFIVLGPAYRAVLLARYSITKIGPGMAKGYKAALASKKIGGIETNRSRVYFEGVLRETDRTEDALSASRIKGSSQARRVSRQHRELPDDLIDWIAREVPRGENGRQVDDLVDAFIRADEEFVAKGGAISSRAQQVATDRLAAQLVERKLIDHIDEVVIDPDTFEVKVLPKNLGPTGVQGSLLTPQAVPLDVPKELVDDIINLRDRIMGRSMPDHFSARITSTANQRDMLMPRRGVLADLRIRTVNNLMLNERFGPKMRRMGALEEKYLADVENADDIQQVFEKNFETIGKDDRRVLATSLPGRAGAAADEVRRSFSSLPNQSYIYVKDSRDADTFYKMARALFSQRTSEYLTQAFKEATPGTRRLMVASVIRSGAAARGVNLTKEEVLGRLDDLATGTRQGEMYAIPTADRPSVLAVQATMRQAQSVAKKRNKDLRRVARADDELTRLHAQLEKELDPLNKLEGATVDSGKVAKLRKKIAAKENQLIRQRGRVTAHDRKLEQFKQRVLRHLSDGQKQKPSRTRANADAAGTHDVIVPSNWYSFPSEWNGTQVATVVERAVDDIEDYLPQAGWWEALMPAPKGPVRQAAPVVSQAEEGQQLLADSGELVTEAGTAPTATSVGRAEAPGAQSAQQLGFDAEGMTPPPQQMVGAQMQELSFGGEDVVRSLHITQDGPGRWVVKDGNEPVATYPSYEAAREHPGIDLESWSGAELDRLDNEAWDTATLADDGTVTLTAPSTYYSSDSGKTLSHTIKPEGDTVVVRTENEAGEWVEVTYEPKMSKAAVPYQRPADVPDWVQVGDVRVSPKIPNKVKDALRGNASRIIDEAEERGFVKPTTGRTVEPEFVENVDDAMDMFDALDEAEQDRLLFALAKERPDLVESRALYEVPIGTGKDVRTTWMYDAEQHPELDDLVAAKMAEPDDRLLVRDMSDAQVIADIERIRPISDKLTGAASNFFDRAVRGVDSGDMKDARYALSQAKYRAMRDGMDLDTAEKPANAPEPLFTENEDVIPGVIYKGYHDGKLALEVDSSVIDEDDAFAVVETLITAARTEMPPEITPALGWVLEDFGDASPMGGLPWTLSRTPARPGQAARYSFKAQSKIDGKPGTWDLTWDEDGRMWGMSTPRVPGGAGIDRDEMARAVEFIDELADELDITAPYVQQADDSVNRFREEMGLPPGRVAAVRQADRLAAKGAEKPVFAHVRTSDKVTESQLVESWQDESITVRRFEFPSGEVRYEATFGEENLKGRITWNDHGGVTTSGWDESITAIEEWARYTAARGVDMTPPGRVAVNGGETPVHRAVKGLGSLDEWLATYSDDEYQDILTLLNDMQASGSTIDDGMRTFIDEQTEAATEAYARRALDDPAIEDGYLASLGYAGDTPPAGAVDVYGKMFDEIEQGISAGRTAGDFAGRAQAGVTEPVDPLAKGWITGSAARRRWESDNIIAAHDLVDLHERLGEDMFSAWWLTGDPDAAFLDDTITTFKLRPDPGKGNIYKRKAARVPGEMSDYQATPKSGKGAEKETLYRPPWAGRNIANRSGETPRMKFIRQHWEAEAEAAVEAVRQGGDFGPLLQYLDDVALHGAVRRGEPITTTGRIVPPQQAQLDIPTTSGPRPVTDEIMAMDPEELDEIVARIAEDRPDLVDGDDSPIESWLDEDTGEMRFELVDEGNLDFQRAFVDATQEPEVPQTGVGAVPEDVPEAVPMPETPPVSMDRSLAGMLDGDFPGASKRLKASIKRTQKFAADGGRIAVKRPREHVNAAGSPDIVPGEVVLLDDDSASYLYESADPTTLYPVDPQDYTKGFVWVPESYEAEVSQALAREAQTLEQFRRHLGGVPEDGWPSLHDEYTDNGTLDLLRALDDAGVTADDIRNMYDPAEKKAFDKSYGGRAMPVRSRQPANWQAAVQNVIDRGLAEDLVGFSADDVAAARAAISTGKPYAPPVGRNLIWSGQHRDDELTEKVTGIKVKNRGGQRKEGAGYPLSPSDVEPDDWYVVDASGAEIMSAFRSAAAAQKAVQQQLRGKAASPLDEAEEAVSVGVPAAEDTIQGTVLNRVDEPIPAAERTSDVPEEAVPDIAGQPPAQTPPGQPPTGGPPPANTPPPGAGDWRPNPIGTQTLVDQDDAVARWIDENSAGQAWSPSRDANGRESALHVYQTSDYVGIPSMTDIEAIRKFRQSPFGDILGKTAQRTTDIWSLGTLYGFRFSQRSSIEDLVVYTMTGGLGRMGDLRRGRSMSQALREGKPSIKTDIDKATGEMILVTQNDKVKMSRLGLVKKRTKAVASTRAGRAADRTAVAATQALGRWTHLKNLESVQTWIAPYASAEETVRAAAYASQGNMIPMRRLVVKIAGRMKLSGLGAQGSAEREMYEGFLGDLAESHTGVKMVESIADDAAAINKGSYPTIHGAIADLSDIPDLEFVRPKNPVMFGEYKKVGVSAKDERDQMGVFFWHRGLQAIVSDDGPIGKIAVTHIDNPPKAKAAVAQAIRDDETFGYQDIYSLIGDNRKIDEFADRYVENVLTYFQNADGSINHKLREKFIQPYVNEDGTKGFTIEWTISDDKGVDRLRVTHNTLHKFSDKNRPQYVLGREVKPVPYPGSEKALLTDRMWDWMGAQYARVAKEPIFLANYLGNRKQLLPLQNSLAQKFAEAAGRKVPSAADNRLAVMAVDKQAQDAAYAFTLAYTDNPRNRSNLAYKVRNVARYYRATEDFYRRMARVARNYPDSFYRLALTYQALDDTGFTYRDENGDLYFAYPMNGLLQDAFATVMSPWKGGFQFGSAVDPFMVGGKVKGLAPSTDPSQWFPTLAGPVGVIPATFFFQRFPGLQGLKTAVLGQYSDAGQTGNEFAELVSAVMPAGVVRALGFLDESELDSTILNASAGALSIMVANGMIDWDPNDPATSARIESSEMWLEADKIGTALAATKLIMGFTVPASPQVYQNNVSSFARDAGISGMKPLFRELLDRNDGDFAAAMTDFVRLEHDNGADNYLPFTISTYETPVSSLAGINSVTATKELAEWGASPEGKRLRDEYPDAYLYLAPRGGEFDYAGWSFLVSTGYKVKKDEHTIIRDILAAKGAREYMEQKALIEAEIATYDKTTESGKEAIKALEADKSLILNGMIESNPFLAEQRRELGQRFSPTAIDAVKLQAWNMVMNEIERGSEDPVVQAIATALELDATFAAAKEGYSAYSNDGKAARDALDAQLAEEYAALGAIDPRVQEFITDILARE